MRILEVWHDHDGSAYAIVQHSEQDQRIYGCKLFEALWLDDEPAYGQLASFGGTPGCRAAAFDTLGEAQTFLLKGIAYQDTNQDIWWEMLAVSSSLEKGGEQQ